MSAALLAAVLGVGAWWGTGPVVTRPMEVMALYLQPGGGLFLRAAGQSSMWLEPDKQQVQFGSPATLTRDPSPLVHLWASTDGRSVLVTTADGQWSAVADALGSIEVRSSGAGRVRGNVNAGGAIDPRVFSLSADGHHLLFAGSDATPALGIVSVGNAPEPI